MYSIEEAREIEVFYDDKMSIGLDVLQRRKRLPEYSQLPIEYDEYVTIQRVKAKYIQRDEAFYNGDSHIYPIFMEVIDELGNITVMTLPEFRDNYSEIRHRLKK